MIPRHPDTMTDEELAEWMLRLVQQQQEESLFLDYKQTISADTRTQRLEIAKDVSSFANTRGGVLLYGIPETEVDGLPVPADEAEIGMQPIDGLPEVVEDVLVGALTPQLPELRIRMLSVPGRQDRVVYLVWHPESWEAPHMVHAYGQHRFYRRGNFRAVLMEEGEIERLYRRRQSRRELVEQFFEEADLGEYVSPEDQVLLRVAICPGLPTENRVDFSREAWQTWFRENIPDGGTGWIPFIEGVRFVSAMGPDRVREHRLFRNGAASILSDRPAVRDTQERAVSGYRLAWSLADFLSFVQRFYLETGITGDVLIDVALMNMSEVRLEVGASATSLRPGLDYTWHQSGLNFRVAASATELLTDERRSALGHRIVDRLGQCFGMWNFSEQYDEIWSGA